MKKGKTSLPTSIKWLNSGSPSLVLAQPFNAGTSERGGTVKKTLRTKRLKRRMSRRFTILLPPSKLGEIMNKLNFVLPTSIAVLLASLFAVGTSAFAQGFSNYVAPQTAQGAANVAQQTPRVQQEGTVALTTIQPSVQPAVQSAEPQPTPAPQPQQQNPAANNAQGGYVADQQAKSAIVQPPETYNPSKEELASLDELLKRWEEHGKKIKRVSCKVHMREFDSVLQQDAKRPVAHTWGEFKFITPNQISYHILGEFEYSDAQPEGQWKQGQNEWQVVLDGKSFTQYDFQNKKAVVYQIPTEEQNIDLTMDNGQFPLFFVAKAETLKSRFYLRIITPKAKQKTEVWIEAFPRYARDAQQFKSITVLLNLKDLQPSYMRRVSANGKSKTDLTFENVAVNKGVWNIEGSVDPSWTKEVKDEQFSILNQQTVVTEGGTRAIVVTDPAKFPSSRKPQTQAARQNQAELNARPQTRSTSAAQTSASSKRF